MIELRVWSLLLYLISGKACNFVISFFKKNTLWVKLLGFAVTSCLLVYSYYYICGSLFETNYYEQLGVKKFYTQQELDQNYKSFKEFLKSELGKTHIDEEKESLQNELEQVETAYSVLSVPVRATYYDIFSSDSEDVASDDLKPESLYVMALLDLFEYFIILILIVMSKTKKQKNQSRLLLLLSIMINNFYMKVDSSGNKSNEVLNKLLPYAATFEIVEYLRLMLYILLRVIELYYEHIEVFFEKYKLISISNNVSNSLQTFIDKLSLAVAEQSNNNQDQNQNENENVITKNYNDNKYIHDKVEKYQDYIDKIKDYNESM